MAELEFTSPRGPCTFCGCTPTDQSQPHSPVLEMIRAVGVDVDWGNDLLVCQPCAGFIADMIGRPSAEKVEKVESRVEFEKKRADSAVKKLEKAEAQLDAIARGRKAVSEVKKERSNG
jgi:hypothetical protein